jgi:hypothetical protein
VMAEITLSHLLRLANEHGCSVSREQALAFLNQQGHAFEMWKQMMQAGEDFIARSLLGIRISPECRSAGVSVHTFRRLLILTARLLRRQSLAVLNRLRARPPRNNGFSSKSYSEARQLSSPQNNIGG